MHIRTATKEDMPKLLTLLREDDAFVRESAAWPLSELGGVALLRDLLVAYGRGLNEGFDNDGFSAALIELVQMDRQESAVELRLLAQASNAQIRENSTWLLEFCTDE